MNKQGKKSMASALEGYRLSLLRHGWTKDQIGTLCVGAPYGPMHYVYRLDADRLPLHDLPGFTGTTGGYSSSHEAYKALRTAARVLWDLDYARRKSNETKEGN